MTKLRLNDYNYSSEGFYFVTLVTKARNNYFANIENNKVVLTDLGLVANEIWEKIPTIYKNIDLDEYIIMPDHIHGILVINNKEKELADNNNNYGLLSKIINSYKNVVTKTIRKKYSNILFNWQRSYYDHVIRESDNLDKIRQYIRYNYLKDYDEIKF